MFFKQEISFFTNVNDTHMEEFVFYWIQYKNSFKDKVDCFWRFSYVYTIS